MALHRQEKALPWAAAEQQSLARAPGSRPPGTPFAPCDSCPRRYRNEKMAASTAGPRRDQLHRKRSALLEHLHAVIEGPMTVLSLVWVALLIVDLTKGLNRPLSW